MGEAKNGVIAHDLRDTSAPDRNLALELVRVTEAAALAAARWSGRGQKESADQAAVDAMHFTLRAVPMDGIVVIGEGEKDEAPMLANGERIGDGSPPEVDVAVDPLEGTTLTARGMPNALSVVALAERGSMFDPGPCVYMEKIAGASDIADLLDLDRPLTETLKLVAKRRESTVSDLMIIILDRERHQEAVEEIRAAGARIRFITDGDVSAAMLAVDRGHRYRSALGDRRYSRGRAVGRRDQEHGRPADRAPLAARRRGASGGDRRRLRPHREPRRGQARLGRRCLLRRHRRDRRRPAPGRALPPRRGDHRVAGDALALRNGAARAGHAQPHQAARADRYALRLTPGVAKDSVFANADTLIGCPAATIEPQPSEQFDFDTLARLDVSTFDVEVGQRVGAQHRRQHV